MITNELIESIQKSWEAEEGFLYKIRYRIFDKKSGDYLLSQLMKVKLNSDVKHIDKELVKTIWYIPIFLEFQKESIETTQTETTYHDYIKLLNKIQDEVGRILGYP